MTIAGSDVTVWASSGFTVAGVRAVATVIKAPRCVRSVIISADSGAYPAVVVEQGAVHVGYVESSLHLKVFDLRNVQLRQSISVR